MYRPPPVSAPPASPWPKYKQYIQPWGINKCLHSSLWSRAVVRFPLSRKCGRMVENISLKRPAAAVVVYQKRKRHSRAAGGGGAPYVSHKCFRPNTCLCQVLYTYIHRLPPNSLSTLAALQRVPAVSIMSSTMITSESSTLPTRSMRSTFSHRTNRGGKQEKKQKRKIIIIIIMPQVTGHKHTHAGRKGAWTPHVKSLEPCFFRRTVRKMSNYYDTTVTYIRPLS